MPPLPPPPAAADQGDQHENAPGCWLPAAAALENYRLLISHFEAVIIYVGAPRHPDGLCSDVYAEVGPGQKMGLANVSQNLIWASESKNFLNFLPCSGAPARYMERPQGGAVNADADVKMEIHDNMTTSSPPVLLHQII
jgi:hypothetical protein